MNQHLQLAPRRASVPVPIRAENATYFEAGPLAFAVEYRELNEKVFADHMATTPGAADAWANRPWADDPEMNKILQLGFGVEGQAPPDIDGVSIHVLDSGSRKEYLRFDAFDDEPHYHYISPGEYHVVVFFDTVAEPDFLEWIMNRLRGRLPAMLEDAGIETLASEVESRYDEVLEVLTAVEESVRMMKAGQRG